MDILNGKGSNSQNQVVIANAGMALYCADSSLGLQGATEKARESLESGNALKSFNTLMNI